MNQFQGWLRSVSFVFALAAGTQTQAGQIRYVDAAAAGSIQNGDAWCNAFLRLQDAIAASSPGDEIRVADGVYRPDQGGGAALGDRTAAFPLRSGVAMFGGFAGCGAVDPDVRDVVLFATILSGDLAEDDLPNFGNYADNSFHVVTYSDPAAVGSVLDGFIIRSGNADGTGPPALTTNQGAAVHIRNGTVKCIPGGPTIRNCTIRDNWAVHHGAVNDHGLGTVIESCTFRDNFAGEEGAGLLIHSGPTRVVGSTFTNNVTNHKGGGVWIGHDDDPSCTAASDPTFTNCLFTANRANLLDGPILDGGAGIYNEGGMLTLADCTFRDNIAFAWGGGLYNDAASGATITNCTFDGNRAEQPSGAQSYGNGGAVGHRSTGHLTMRNCSMIGNYATTAGALHVSGPATLTDCTFDGNTAGYTGAIRNWSNLTLARCTLRNNTAQGAGALQCEAPGTVTMTNCRLIGNRATNVFAGAILNNSSAGFIATNCLFAENTARWGGGAVYNMANLTLANCTVTGNKSTYSGNGAVADDGTGAISIMNSVLWGNLSPTNQSQEIDQIYINGGALVVGYSCVQAWSGLLGGIGNIGLDPGFSNPSDGNYRLSETSPCLDAGADAAVPTDLLDVDDDGNAAEPTPLDLDGLDRIAYTHVDMGAYEYGLCPPGFFSADGVQPCDSCIPGTHQSNAGSLACLPCPAGSYQALAGSAACQACAPGTVQPMEGSTSCQDCDPGTYQPDGGAGACLPCEPGTFAPSSASSACTACGAGTYQPGSGQSACLGCSCDDGDACTADGCDAVDGTCQNQDVCGGIPAVSEWGILVLLLLMGGAGAILAPRCKPSVSRAASV